MTRWNAQSLPIPRPAARKVQQVSRLESIAQISLIIVLVCWLRLVSDRPFLLFGPAADTYRIGPIWQQVVLPTLLILAVSVAQSVVNLFRPDWTRLQLAVRLLTDAAVFGIVAYLLQGNHWVILANPNGAGAGTLGTINEYVYYGLLSTQIGIVIVVLLDAWKLLRGWKKRAANSALA